MLCGLKLRMRHRSGGASDSGGVFSGCAFDLHEITPPPSVGAVSAGGPAQSSTPALPHFPLFSPLAGSSFPRGGEFTSAANTPRTPTTITGGPSVATIVPSTQQANVAAAVSARRKSKIAKGCSSVDEPSGETRWEVSGRRTTLMESGGSILDNYARGFATPSSSSSSSLTNQPSTSSQQRTNSGIRSLGKCSPQPLTPSYISSMPAAFKSLIPWWTPGSDAGERQKQHHFHHPDNEYLNSLVTDELRTQLTMQISSQMHPKAQSSGVTKRGSGLFDDDPLGGVTVSPLASPRGVPMLSSGPSNQSSSSIPTVATTVAGCSVSAPVCIPNNGGRNRGDAEAFDYPCSCGCCRRGGHVGGTESRAGGHDSAFNSGGTPTAMCEFGAVGSISLHSMTSEGHDSALALSEAKEGPTTPDLPSSLLQDTHQMTLSERNGIYPLFSPSKSTKVAWGCYGNSTVMRLPSTLIFGHILSFEDSDLFKLLANVYQSQGLLQGSDGASTTTASTGGTTSVAISDIDKSGAFSLSTTQSPSLQDLEAFRCEYADQSQQTLALQIVVRQIVMILFNHLAEVRRMQEKAPQTPPSTSSPSATTAPASSIRDTASLNLLNDLLRVLLCDPTVRNALNSENTTVPVNTTQILASTTGTGLKRPSSLRRKSSSKPPGSWSAGGVLEDLEEEDQSRMGSIEESGSFEDDLRFALFSSAASRHHRNHQFQQQPSTEHSSSNSNNNGNSSSTLNP
ncbi:unnamed protein product [Hymenolepis diminuta]|uniref:Protein kinase n=1 Tax=Hymenolepis diminuta TaxID=6216 RepID=A0A158QFV7_HYMDI|nr:unnamed protein product [Hymenolepis diminuta]